MRREKGRFWTKYDKVQQAESTETVSNLDGSLYVIMFNSHEGRHSNDIREVYHHLINRGVSDTDISVLEGDGRTRNRFVDKSATIRNLDSVVDSIRQKATPDDRLLVYITNHGNISNGQCYVSAYDDTIWEKDFEQMMQDLPVNFGLFYFAQCYSGGFAERMGYGRNIGMSNASRDEQSAGSILKGACFTPYLFSRVLKEGVTIEGAFDSAVIRDTHLLSHSRLTIGETPQLRWQNANPSELYLGSTSPSKK